MLKDIAPRPEPGGVAKARKLRKDMSLPEVLLWRLLKGQPRGVKFRRQHPTSRIRADFYCSDARFLIEVDGASHDMGDQPQRDIGRDRWTNAQGFETIRIPASDVLRNPTAVADVLVEMALARLPRNHPAALAASVNAPPSTLRAATSPRQARGGSKEPA
jgi:very-short-patch-repair endonuclease